MDVLLLQVYPWALLVFWQLLMPGVSFWGHLGGLMAGEAYVRGWLKALMPGQSLFQVGSLNSHHAFLRALDELFCNGVSRARLAQTQHCP